MWSWCCLVSGVIPAALLVNPGERERGNFAHNLLTSKGAAMSLESRVNQLVSMSPADRASALAGENAMIRRMVGERVAEREAAPVATISSPVATAAPAPGAPAPVLSPESLAPMVQQLLFNMLAGQAAAAVPAPAAPVQATPAKSSKGSKSSKSGKSKASATPAAKAPAGSLFSPIVSLGEFNGAATLVIRQSGTDPEKAPAFCCGRAKALALLSALSADPDGFRQALRVVAGL